MQTTIRSAVLAFLFVGVTTAGAFTNPFTGIVSFGDSLSDLGNTVDEFDSFFGGETLLYNDTGYSNTYYDVGRWSNGPVWVENLNTLLDLPSPLQRNDGSGSNIFGTNFAWGGSLSGTGTTDYGFVNNLQTQVANYVSILNAPVTGQPNPATTLFTVWSGGNDVIDVVTENATITPQNVADNIGTAITTLYQAGGRSFLVPNLPPLGDKPNFINTAFSVPANAFVQAYNPLLATVLDSLETQLTGIQIIRMDVYDLFTDILNNPGDYGFTNVTDQAYTANGNPPDGGTVVPNPDQYLFWDGTHPTRIGHQYLGQYAYDVVVTAVPEPATIIPIALGALFVIAVHRRRRRA